jgi:dipeptidyl aminopeptidase/acylaminoacyl peptidase
MCLLLLYFPAIAHLGAQDLDLDRSTPVPADTPIPIADFFRLPLLYGARLDRTGTHVAGLGASSEDRTALFVYDLGTNKFDVLQPRENEDIYSFTWLDENRILYSLSDKKLYDLAMLAVDIRSLSNSYPLLQYWGADLVSVPAHDRLNPLVWLRYDGFNANLDLGVAKIRTDLNSGPMFDLRAASGANRTVELQVQHANEQHVISHYPVPSGGLDAEYLADRDGELAFAFTATDGVFSLHRLVDGKWERCPEDLDQLQVLAAGDQPGEVVVLAPREPGKPRALKLMDAASGKSGDTLLQETSYDFDGWLYRDRVTRNIVGAQYYRKALHSTWFDDRYRAIQQIIDARFRGQVARIVDGDPSGTLLVETTSDRKPATYHWVNMAKKAAGLIKNSEPWIDPERMQPMSMMAFKTRDGRQLDAYVTFPKGSSKDRPAPLVVLSHGGPWARDTWGFNGEVQFLASRGYAVLQTNYRGSLGYDWMFPTEDRYAFRKMHDDVTDAAKTLISSGLVDPKRVAIMGSSFGAYLALSGVTYEPSLYRCAVPISGVFDWESVLRNKKSGEYSDTYSGTSISYSVLKRRLGDPALEIGKFDAISPARHVDQIRVPVFVSHGEDDPVADVEGSRRLISDLKKYHVPCEELIVSGEGHGMHYLKNRVELYSRVEAFLAKNLAPQNVQAPQK